MEPQQKNIDQQLAERFKTLPKVIQDVITSADVQKHLRELADIHKLHLDQWQALENEVMLTLLGLQPTQKLADNVQSEVGVSSDIAAALAGDISKIVFEPIRAELERSLEHPEAKAEEKSDMETMRDQTLSAQGAPKPTAPVPSTPPAPSPDGKAVRAPISTSYTSGQTSAARKAVHDDPYREPPA